MFPGGGCGSGSPENSRFVLGDIGWDESVAVANLTKVLLGDEVGAPTLCSLSLAFYA